jgi:16S rRNA (cytosine967-C5)-methyltransferase
LNFDVPLTMSLNLVDLPKKINQPMINSANLIIADLPCSGSGTWRRTPEERIKPLNLEGFTQKQFKIIENILELKKASNSSYFIYYLTCSIFSAENEETIQSLKEKYPQIESLWEHFFGGYDENADFIYGSLLKVNPV